MYSLNQLKYFIMKLSTIGQLKLDRKEDGGQALICENLPIVTGHSDEENGMFVVLQSWDVDTVHTDLNFFLNEKVKITIEIVK